MKYILELSHRISQHVPMESKHATIMAFLKEIEGNFGIKTDKLRTKLID